MGVLTISVKKKKKKNLSKFLEWFINYLKKKINPISYTIFYQNKITYTNTISIFKNAISQRNSHPSQSNVAEPNFLLVMHEIILFLLYSALMQLSASNDEKTH